MKTAGIYMLEVIVCSGLLLAFYQLLLARKVPYRAARRFLLASALLSVLIPALRLPILPAETVYLQIPVGELPAGVGAPAADDAASVTVAAAFPWQGVLTALYGGVALLLLAVLVRNLARIRRLRQASRLTPLRDYTLAEHPRVQSPFSFWRTIFLRQEECPDAGQRAIIVAHEAAHIRHRHSRDKVALGILKALCWFNPFLWMMERMLSEVQEYEADEDVLRAGYPIDNYRLAIFKQLFGYYPDLTSGLSHSLTKKRFTMMNQAPRGSLSWLRFGAALPLFAGLLVAFGATARPASPVPQGPDQALVEQDKVIRIDISEQTGTVAVNGETVALPDLKNHLQNLISTEGEVQSISIRGDEKARMGVLNDVKDILRSIGQLKIMYTAPEEHAVERRLPPPVGVGGAVTTEEALKSVDRNNLLVVRINSADRILAGTTVIRDDRHLLDLSKDFIRNHAPRAVISLQMDNGTSYSKFFDVQQLLKQAYDEVRGEQAQSRYGKTLADLTPDERDAILWDVPMAITEAEMAEPPMSARR
jgi:Antirepressor regulating drug resistance, predicted signal transduction N-terminal membrane component